MLSLSSPAQYVSCHRNSSFLAKGGLATPDGEPCTSGNSSARTYLGHLVLDQSLRSILHELAGRAAAIPTANACDNRPDSRQRSPKHRSSRLVGLRGATMSTLVGHWEPLEVWRCVPETAPRQFQAGFGQLLVSNGQRPARSISPTGQTGGPARRSKPALPMAPAVRPNGGSCAAARRVVRRLPPHRPWILRRPSP